MNYWVFSCNPKLYRLDERLNNSEKIITWRVNQYRKEVRPDDTAFIWQTGRDRGIRAIMHIDTAPTEMEEIETEKPYYIEPDFKPTPITRVRGTLEDRFPVVRANLLKEIPILSSMSVIRGPFQGTNFRVTNDAGKFLAEYIKTQRQI